MCFAYFTEDTAKYFPQGHSNVVRMYVTASVFSTV